MLRKIIVTIKYVRKFIKTHLYHKLHWWISCYTITENLDTQYVHIHSTI